MENLKAKIKEIVSHKRATISGLGEGEKCFLPLFFDAKTLIVAPNFDSAEKYEAFLTSFGKKVLVLDKKIPLMFSFSDIHSKEYKDVTLALGNIIQGNYDYIVATPDFLFQKLPKKEVFEDKSLFIETGKNYNLEHLSQKLVQMGYRREDFVYEKGLFSLRGDLLDIYPLNLNRPIRISFFDDEVESINFLNSENFVQEEKTDSANVSCATILFVEEENKEKIKAQINKDLSSLSLTAESMLRLSQIVQNQFDMLDGNSMPSSVFFLPYMDYFSASIFDYLPKDAKIVFDEPKLISDALKIVEDENVASFLDLSIKGEFLPKHMSFYFERKNVLSQITPFSLVAYTRLISQNKIFENENIFNFICPDVEKYTNNYTKLVVDTQNLVKNHNTVILVCGDDLTQNKIQNFFGESNVDITSISSFDEAMEDKINVILNGPESSAFFEMERFVLIGSKNLCAHRINTQKRESNAIATYTPNVGDYVVHEVHGIGKCVGIENLKITNSYRDYIVIEYLGGDKLYLPSENADMISKFSGEKEPKLNKIGGTEFFKIKQKVKSSIKEVAFDLLKVYSDRLSAKGFVYSKDSYLQVAFENSFNFDYTTDQENALREIKADMESTRIMDRLLCGDVGFGKTEVALATAFKAIQDGKQVAIICPTTILCEQHYAVASERMSKFMVRVEALNRFKTKKEQSSIIEKLKNGEIDLICGTHRLLSSDVKFKDLGLIIIDEEQRFGVEDKDKLKNIKRTVDVLSLSATPIPRTLYMSLSGIRDVSFLSTPPKERKKIQTSVIDYSDALLVDACKKELDRGGQVLIIYNRVESIMSFYRHVQDLLPDVKIGVAHGQMPPKTLENAIYDLYSRKTSVLISTVLIENGIDLPYANTLFVIDSDKLGLSQLYQLRGRIGRSNIEAYAYFSFKRGKVLTIDSYKRLDAIMEFSDFGSGYKIALRDLEIRGAGDVLGKIQHGHMGKVGYDMYIKLLGEVVRELKGEENKEKKDIKLDMSISAFVPESYIPSSEGRISLYSSISRLENLDELKNFVSLTEAKYSTMPSEVLELCFVGLIKNLGQNIYVKKIVLNDFNCKITFYENILGTKLYEYLSKGGVNFVLSLEKEPIITLSREKNVQKTQDELIKFLMECQKQLQKKSE